MARWFSDHEILVLGDSAYGGQSVLSHLPPNVHLISRVHPKGALYKPTPKAPGPRGPLEERRSSPRQGRGGGRRPRATWTRLDFDQFGLHAALEVKTMQALYYKSGGDRLLKIVLVRDREGKRPDQMFYSTKREWTARQVLSAYARRWATECTFEYCKQFLGLEDPANRLPKAVERTAPMAMFIYSLVVVWFHQAGHRLLRFPFRPWYPKKREPSFADMLTTLRRLSYEEKTEGLVADETPLKTWIAQAPPSFSAGPGERPGARGFPDDARPDERSSRGEFKPPGRSRYAHSSAKLELRYIAACLALMIVVAAAVRGCAIVFDVATFMSGPGLESGDVERLQAGVAPLIERLKHERRIRGRYPETLESIGEKAPTTRFGLWVYRCYRQGDAFSLTIGDYGKNGFVLWWDSPSGDWGIDT